ncbi:MAG: ABC transporter ATP-binding protein [Phaeodactylibacter sp.]|nr:ABC transporter ATP-binding protein [Phaeodactylibacter sp.]
MRIVLEDASKRYRHEWIFKKINYELHSGEAYAVLGYNGSGKSTFLRILSGHLSCSRGQITFFKGDAPVPISEVYRLVSFAGPYIELIEEMTLREILDFQRRFKPFLEDWTLEQLAVLLQLPTALHKEVGHFSSGMKQRLRLGLAILADSPILLLDEPTSNLDEAGVAWYRGMVEKYRTGRLVVVASNVPQDYHFCEHHIDITTYKPTATSR